MANNNIVFAPASKAQEQFLLSDSFLTIYGRKHAYKGVCDGLAGYDVSIDFSGDDYVNAYK